MSTTTILVTDVNGQPRSWSTLEEACCYYARGKVRWGVGTSVHTFLGGHNLNGEQSRIDIEPVLGVTGPLVGTEWLDRTSVYVERKILYNRDLCICAYCGQQIKPYLLTIDHILPKSRGGKNIWQNAVSACKSCNHAKGNRTPEEWGVKLLYVPYVPTCAEKYIMKARNILADQMDFLVASVPRHSRLFDVDGKIRPLYNG
ncbi:MAG: HNH endonuclease [Candidatus Dormibacteria bacterium]